MTNHIPVPIIAGFLGAAFAAAMFAGLNVPTEPKHGPERIVEVVVEGDGNVRISALGRPGSGTAAVCAGTPINKRTLLFAAHCVAMQVKLLGGGPVLVQTRFRDYQAMIMAVDPDRDLAIARTSDDMDVTPVEMRPQSEPLRLLETVYVVGNPMAIPNTIHRGVVSNLRNWYGNDGHFQTDAMVSQGFSGGAALDDYGRLVGVVQSYIGYENETNTEGAVVRVAPQYYHLGIVADMDLVRSFLLQFCTDSKCTATRERVIDHGH